MTKEEIKAVTRVLHDNIIRNEELTKDTDNLGKVVIDALNFESAACVKVIKILEAIGGVENDK